MMIKVDISELRKLLVQVAECSTSIRACHEVAGYEDVPDTVARYTQLMELLRDQFTLCRQAHEWITDAAAYTRAPLSARIRAKIYEGGECNKRLGEFLQVLDDHADTLPLYFTPPTFEDIPQLRRYQTRHSSTPYMTPSSLPRRARSKSALPKTDTYPPLLGATPLPDTEPIPVGALCAFWDTRESEAKWILAEVLEYKNDAFGVHYTLVDHMAEFEFHKQYNKDLQRDNLPLVDLASVCYPLQRDDLPFLLKRIRRQRLRALPNARAHPRLQPNALFGPGVLVMARFPKTTVFYRACVVAPPSEPNEGYQVTFDLDADLDLDSYGRDSSVSIYTIPQLYVIQEVADPRHSSMAHKQ